MPSSRRRAGFAVALVTLLSSLPAAQAVAAPSPAPAGPLLHGRVLVGFAAGALPAPGSSVAGLRVVDRVPALDVVVVSAPAGVAPGDLEALPGVRYAEEDVQLRSLVTPNDTRYREQYGPPMMGAPAAWDRAGYGSSAVKVAVIDTGIRRTHQDLSGRVLQGYDYVNGDTNPNDDCGHGTHVSGTVGATTGNGVGVAGMSQATILPMKALSPVGGLVNVTCTGSTAGIAKAITDSTDQGADVISMSLGGGGTTTLQAAVDYAWNRGVLVVAAAGNDGADNSVDFPAAYANSIAVAALEPNKARASYSDGGPQLDIAAPGSDVLSTYNGSDSSYSSLSGTSMATPHVAGALALALSCAPSATNVQLRDALYATAEDLGAAGRDNAFGHGLARVDRLVASACGGGTPTNTKPTAAFTTSTSGLTATVDGRGSSDPDGDPLTYAWTFGDGVSATGATASRTYATAGTYTVTLTVSDGRGGSGSTSRTVTVGSAGDPDPSTPTITSGQTVSMAVSATNAERFYKVQVPAGATRLTVVTDGPDCGLLSCSVDTDLYTRPEARPTDSAYSCRPYASGSDETCTHQPPTSTTGWWYIRVERYSGSGTVTLKATVT